MQRGKYAVRYSAEISLDDDFNVLFSSAGVWRRVPRDYRRLLRDNQINVVLIWGKQSPCLLRIKITTIVC